MRWSSRTPEQLALQKELDSLNAEVESAVAKRMAWMDAHMADFAEYPIGTELYKRTPDRGSAHFGDYLGKVTEYYRYHRNDHRYDARMDIDYRTDSGHNSSSLSGMVESKEQRADRLDREAKYLRSVPIG